MALTLITVTTFDASGAGSLSQAIDDANDATNPVEIVFSAGMAGTIDFTDTLSLHNDITINGDTNGDGRADITLSGQGSHRLFDANTSGTSIRFQSLNIVDGSTPNTGESGGAILVRNGVTVTIANSTLSGNHADDAGGAIFSEGTLQIVNSTLTGNDANNRGGAVYVVDGHSLTMVNTTITGNTANHSTGMYPSTGGGLSVGESVSITATNSTIVGNHADEGGGIEMGDSTTLNMTNTIVSGNVAADNANVVRFGSVVITASHSIVGTDVTVGVNNGGNHSTNAAVVGALADHGGAVETMIPIGIALDAGVDITTDPLNADGDIFTDDPLSVDARGALRKFGAAVDIGAYERIGVADASSVVVEDSSTATVSNLAIHDSIGSAKVMWAHPGIPDNPVAFDAVSQIAGTATVFTGTYGTLSIYADGYYSYTLNNADPDTNALATGQNVFDKFTVLLQLTPGDTVAFDTATISIQVQGHTDNVAPLITSNGGGVTATINVIENIGNVTTVTATDTGTLTYSLAGGVDEDQFQINASTGALTFKNAPDFEAPTDSNGDNTYDVIVRASDGTLHDDQTLTVLVGNIEGNTIKGTGKNDKIDLKHSVHSKHATGEEDQIRGQGGKDTINAGDGNDSVQGGSGKDKLDGGAGIDTAVYTDHGNHAIAVNLSLGKKGISTVKVDGHIEDTLRHFENVIGAGGNDNLTGTDGDNMFVGLNGDDRLSGGKGHDILSGGAGADTLTGGADADQFRFDVTYYSYNADHITDFEHGVDQIVLDHNTFAAFAAGDIGEGELIVGKNAKKLVARDDDDHLLYNKKTGALFYDNDGKGGTDAFLIATLDGKKHPMLDHHDFLII